MTKTQAIASRLRRGKRDEAIASVRTALRLKPGLPEALQALKQLGVEP